MTHRWLPDDSQMTLRWLRWLSDDSRMALRWLSDGSQMTSRWLLVLDDSQMTQMFPISDETSLDDSIWLIGDPYNSFATPRWLLDDSQMTPRWFLDDSQMTPKWLINDSWYDLQYECQSWIAPIFKLVKIIGGRMDPIFTVNYFERNCPWKD